MNRNLFYQSLKNFHNQIILCGLVVGFLYLPIWLAESWYRVTKGDAMPLVIFAAVYVALQELWSKRNKLSKLTASIAQRRFGYVLILSSLAVFPFSQFAVWPQALVWLVVLIGIALSSWGVGFFNKYPRPVLLILISVHPGFDIVLGQLWRTFTPDQILERWMAWSGSLALQAIGQPATANGINISLPPSGVEVWWGCNGFDMAMTMAATGLLIGFVLHQTWLKTLGLVILGIVLAMVFNVPRIMMLALAAVFWGEESFNFWHGPWGGQVFSTILFTAYYYLMMSIVPQPPAKKQKYKGRRQKETNI